MKVRVGVLLLALAALLVAGRATSGQQGGQEDDVASPRLRIDWTEFKKLYDAGRIELVDVRSVDAFKAGHIPGARSIPLDEIEKRVGELRKAKKPIVTYCA